MYMENFRHYAGTCTTYSVLCTMCHTFGRQIIEIYIFVWLFKIDINFIINIRKY